MFKPVLQAGLFGHFYCSFLLFLVQCSITTLFFYLQKMNNKGVQTFFALTAATNMLDDLKSALAGN